MKHPPIRVKGQHSVRNYFPPICSTNWVSSFAPRRRVASRRPDGFGGWLRSGTLFSSGTSVPGSGRQSFSSFAFRMGEDASGRAPSKAVPSRRASGLEFPRFRHDPSIRKLLYVSRAWSSIYYSPELSRIPNFYRGLADMWLLERSERTRISKRKGDFPLDRVDISHSRSVVQLQSFFLKCSCAAFSLHLLS